ncbi:MAG: PLDc N-terminal domain-containing protein [Candidatus Nanopelagicales bacterium]
MVKVLLGLAALGLLIFALIDLFQVRSDDVRGGSRFLWLLAILLLPVVGAVLWLVFGREPAEGPKRRTLPPDDDPDFLRKVRPR